MFAGLAYPLVNLVSPSFNAVLSPKGVAQKMRVFIDAGYRIVSYDDYGGTFSFYTEHAIIEVPKKKPRTIAQPTNTPEAQADQTPQTWGLPGLKGELAKPGGVALAIKRSEWENWSDKPTDMTQVAQQWIETQMYLLLARPVNAAGMPMQADDAPAQPADLQSQELAVPVNPAPAEQMPPTSKEEPPSPDSNSSLRTAPESAPPPEASPPK
jgi:hypothetical protein